MISKSARALSPLLLCILLGWVPSAGQTNSPEVSVSGNISSHAVRKDELLQFTLTIRNKADAKAGAGSSLRALTLLRMPDSYSLDGKQQICVFPLLPLRTDSCETSADFSKSHNLLAASLASGESLTVQGYLMPTAVHKTAALIAVVSWTVVDSTEPSVQVTSSLPVSLGENQVQSAAWEWSLWEFLKTMSLPLLLGFVGALTGFILNWVNRNRDQHLADIEKKRDTEIRREENEHHEAQRRNRYYLQLSLAAERQAGNLRVLTTTGTRARVAFFYTLVSSNEIVRVRKAVGGFYFKDLRGEVLAAGCLARQRQALTGSDEEAPFDLALRAAVDRIRDIESYAEFKRSFPEVAGATTTTYADPDIQAAWSHFDQWRTNQHEVEDVAKYLEAFFAVLDYECNRYEWYSTSPRLLASSQTEQVLRSVLSDYQYAPTEIDDYFKVVVRP
jgi:hypothetical protein